MATGLPTLTSETFDEEIGAADLPFVVDVWADWCPPCEALDPVLASIADLVSWDSATRSRRRPAVRSTTRPSIEGTTRTPLRGQRPSQPAMSR